MGPLRRGLMLGLAPLPAWAEVCDKERPYWEPGTAPTAWSEALHFLLSPAGIFVALLFFLAVAIRTPWLLWFSVAASCLSLLALAINPALPDPTGMRYFAVMEGCVGSSTLSVVFLLLIAGVAASVARRASR